MTTMKLGDPFSEAGVYKVAVANGNRTAVCSCPKCGKTFHLAEHHITDEGAVSPSVVCPRVECPNFMACGFHDIVSLAGWVRDSEIKRETK